MKTKIIENSILKIGEVNGIEGRKIFIRLDKEKNSSDLIFNGKLIKNISVGSYIEIRKGFLSLIGKIEGEKLEEEKYNKDHKYQYFNKNKRTLQTLLIGYISSDGYFSAGIKELPLIGNEAYILIEEKIRSVHNLLKDKTQLKINIAKTEIEDIDISFPIDGLFNTHIAIFGNTGSGKSNTLASLYQKLFLLLSNNKKFKTNFYYLFFDFNGEYIKDDCLSDKKKVYNLSTRVSTEDKINLEFDHLIDIETLSVLFEATEKTQKPFLKRTLSYFNKVRKNESPFEYFQNIFKKNVRQMLLISNKDIAHKIKDYIEEISKLLVKDKEEPDLYSDLSWHNVYSNFFLPKSPTRAENGYIDNQNSPNIENTKIYEFACNLNKKNYENLKDLDLFYIFIILQLINDLYRYKVQLDHILPLINRFKAKKKNIENIFEVKSNADIWDKKNIIVINLHDVNLDMKKTIPLLIAKHIYKKHKKHNNKKSLSIIIDEAHNILSKSSFRESEDWKDYRLETFEEIIKEGRKFGVFVTIASQRPNDISDTIISQAHNYFIHQLINHRDLQAISNAISYIDKISEEAIPTLSTGTCILSGITSPMPLKIRIKELDDIHKPDSNTLTYKKILN